MSSITLSYLIQSFFTCKHQQHGLSSLTLLSYRDSIKLFLRYAVETTGKSIIKLTVEHLTPELVSNFLKHLESQRGNQISTRNNRLIAIRCFFAYVAQEELAYADQCRKICALPLKKAPTRNIGYFESDEIQALLSAPDQEFAAGRRDYALLLFLYNSGARVQEVLGVKAKDISLERPRQVLLQGKGKKERICPLWEETTQVLKSLMNEEGIEAGSRKQVFLNRQKQPLSRFGVDYLVKKYGKMALAKVPSLAHKRISPHTIRHTTAVHLLNAGVDINVIRSWLGHVNLQTTNIYVEINMETKRKALETCRPQNPSSKISQPSWKKNQDILAWLENLERNNVENKR